MGKGLTSGEERESGTKHCSQETCRGQNRSGIDHIGVDQVVEKPQEHYYHPKAKRAAPIMLTL